MLVTVIQTSSSRNLMSSTAPKTPMPLPGEVIESDPSAFRMPAKTAKHVNQRPEIPTCASGTAIVADLDHCTQIA